MRVDATVAQLRPRPMFEAADLGVRLVQAHAGSLLRCAGPVFLALALVALALQPLAWWAPALALWIIRPWWDRSVLFVLARALFHEPSRFADLWAAQRVVWWQGLLASFTTRLFSPWRSFTAPASQLEGLRGSALRKRRAQLRQGHQGAALATSLAFWLIELSLYLGLPGLLLWMVPGGDMGTSFDWVRRANDGLLNAALNVTAAMTAAFVEPFFVGAGFAMYINRRVELEAWDVEQALRHAFKTA